MIDGVFCDINAAVDRELERARAEYGQRYASIHEAYGVLMEEMHEAQAEIRDLDDYAAALIGVIHREDRRALFAELDVMGNRAIQAACELVQVAAVCRKAMEGIGDG